MVRFAVLKESSYLKMKKTFSVMVGQSEVVRGVFKGIVE